MDCKKRIVFCSHCSDEKRIFFGADKLIASIKYFHPEIPFIMMGNKEIEEEIKKDPTLNFCTLNPTMSIRLAKDYDIVVHFAADSMLVDRLDELINGDYDIASVRNNDDSNNGVSERYLNIPVYLNAGLVASTKIDFWEEWIERNKNEAKNFKWQEQDIMNQIFYSGKYNTKLLDPVEENLHYGFSSPFYTWRNLKIKNDHLYLNNKKVKILHHAAGGDSPRLQFEKLCDKNTCKWLENIYKEKNNF